MFFSTKLKTPASSRGFSGTKSDNFFFWTVRLGCFHRIGFKGFS
jgi:hypothetical protein